MNQQCKSNNCAAGICHSRPKYKISVYLRGAAVCNQEMRWGDKSDAYAKLELNVRGRREVKTSKRVENNHLPLWKEWIHWGTIFEQQDDNETFRLKIHLYDWDWNDDTRHHDNLGYYQQTFDLKPTDKLYEGQGLHGSPCSDTDHGNPRVLFQLKVEEV